ncbi:hypothetical protein [Nocardia spumae]|uniref:hypothetical protein n=1 Tax=Nocardia spumae TaxID=2887190 RepID=UPI001D142A36|nr:hypothetical protein [Nocardia spumae]
MNIVRRVGIAIAGLAVAGLSATGFAAADPTPVPFQVNPAPYGNPNGSFDVPPIHCAVVLDHPGSAVITGGNPGQWGCLLSSTVQWLNLTTGVSGVAQLSNGLNGIPPQATLNTGPGRIVLILTPLNGGTTTPGFATFAVG